MGRSYISNHIHAVFSTKNRVRSIKEQMQPKLWAYMVGIAENHGMHAVKIGEIEDHLHLLINLGGELGIIKAVQLIKSNSSRWMNEHPGPRFEWQEGYFACSVSRSQVSRVIKYIADQKEHHRKIDSEEEFRVLLKKHGSSITAISCAVPLGLGFFSLFSGDYRPRLQIMPSLRDCFDEGCSSSFQPLSPSRTRSWRLRRYRPNGWENALPGCGAMALSAFANPPWRRVTRYIRNQEAHHRKMNYEQEFIALLEKHGVDYDPEDIFREPCVRFRSRIFLCRLKRSSTWLRIEIACSKGRIVSSALTILRSALPP